MKLASLPSLRLPPRIGWRDHLIGAALAVLYVAVLLGTADSIGFMRDESTYFRAASSYFSWLRMLYERGAVALTQNAVDGPWSENHEHPALMKTLFGLSWGLLHEGWHVFRDASTSYRFPAMCLAGGALWTTYLFGARAMNRTAGLVAAGLLALMPRVFFHSHLACFDVPIMTMWLLAVYVYWRAVEKGGIGWAIAAGAVFGLALETKHNAWMLPAVFVPHALFVHRHAIARGLRAGRVSLPSTLVSMAILGPLVLYALWPYLWFDTVARLQWWFDFHLHHTYYSIEFLHRNYRGPPSPKAFAPVMILATVPTVTLALFVVGGFDRVRIAVRRLWLWLRERAAVGLPAQAAVGRDRCETDLLLLLAFAVPLAPFFLEKTPIFGATKHWLTAYPFLALYAGHGFDKAAATLRATLTTGSRTIHGNWGARASQAAAYAPALLVPFVFAAPLAETVHSNPYGLATYVPLVGGVAGGADLGLNRQFWGYTSQNAASEYLNKNAPPNATVFIHDTTFDAWQRMQQEGRVRRDLRAVGAPHDSQIALVEYELHMTELDDAIWIVFGNDAPAYVVKHDGVPIVTIYRR